MLEKLKKELLGKEINFQELDAYMIKNSFYSVLDDGITKEIKHDKNVTYTGIKSGECEVLIKFEIIIDSVEDESEDNFILQITRIENLLKDRNKISVVKILNMKNEEIIGMLNLEEREFAEKKFRSLNNFCDAYQDAAELSHQEEYFTPSGYLLKKMQVSYFLKIGEKNRKSI